MDYWVHLALFITSLGTYFYGYSKGIRATEDKIKRGIRLKESVNVDGIPLVCFVIPERFRDESLRATISFKKTGHG